MAAWCAIAAILAPAAALAQASGSASAAGSGNVALPEIQVIGTTPMPPPRRAARRPAPAAARAATAPAAAPVTAQATPAVAEPGAVDRDKIPSNVQTLSAADFDKGVAPDLLSALSRSVPGLALSDQTGNQFQLDLNYRGFIASPVVGTPQGLAVYQNGVRINEVFGDTVNWDFIPETAISGMTLVPSNPVYGLNAIGGALSFEMKNGFTYHGVEDATSGGSFGRIGTSIQAGGQNGNMSGYIAADAIDDAGWRQVDSPSQLRRLYADAGIRGGDNTEFHLTLNRGRQSLSAPPRRAPVEMLSQDWSSVYTIPQTTHDQLTFLTGSASWKPSDTLTYQAVAYYRHFQQAHVDGNGTGCGRIPGAPTPLSLCFPNLDGNTSSNLITTGGQTVPATGALLPRHRSWSAKSDRTWTNTNSFWRLGPGRVIGRFCSVTATTLCSA